MEYPGFGMERILTPDAAAFIDEWHNSADYVIAHTSGSTGKPKTIRLSKCDMRASAHATINFFGLTSRSTLYLPLSPDYIAGKMQIVRALEAGCSLIVTPPSNNIQPANRNLPIDLLPIVPSQIPGLLESDILRRTNNVIVGGAPVTAEAEKALMQAAPNSFATYGMTETCSHVALRKFGEKHFRALPGFNFSTDSRGCLIISTSTLSFGTLTTNDIVELCDSSTFRWLGRFDNIINSGGLKISPEEIERIIAPMFPAGCLFYVTSRPSPQWGEEAVIITDAENLPDDFIRSLHQLLPARKVPKSVIYRREIPLTASKKIIRQKII